MSVTSNLAMLDKTSSKEDIESHSILRSVILHLLPGILIGIVFFSIAPIAQHNGLPPVWAHGIADLVVLVPFVFGLLYYEGYKRNGRLSLSGSLSRANPLVAIPDFCAALAGGRRAHPIAGPC